MRVIGRSIVWPIIATGVKRTYHRGWAMAANSGAASVVSKNGSWSLAGWIAMGHLLTTNLLIGIAPWFPDGPVHYLTWVVLLVLEAPLMYTIPLFFYTLQHSDYARILFELIPIGLLLAAYFLLMFLNSVLCGYTIAWLIRRPHRGRDLVTGLLAG